MISERKGIMIEKISLNVNLFENSLPFCCRDKKALDDWREKTKLLRQQKQRLSAVKGSSMGKAPNNFHQFVCLWIT